MARWNPTCRGRTWLAVVSVVAVVAVVAVVVAVVVVPSGSCRRGWHSNIRCRRSSNWEWRRRQW